MGAHQGYFESQEIILGLKTAILGLRVAIKEFKEVTRSPERYFGALGNSPGASKRTSSSLGIYFGGPGWYLGAEGSFFGAEGGH